MVFPDQRLAQLSIEGWSGGGGDDLFSEGSCKQCSTSTSTSTVSLLFIHVYAVKSGYIKNRDNRRDLKYRPLLRGVRCTNDGLGEVISAVVVLYTIIALCWNFKRSIGARKRVAIGKSYRTGQPVYIGWWNRSL